MKKTSMKKKSMPKRMVAVCLSAALMFTQTGTISFAEDEPIARGIQDSSESQSNEQKMEAQVSTENVAAETNSENSADILEVTEKTTDETIETEVETYEDETEDSMEAAILSLEEKDNYIVYYCCGQEQESKQYENITLSDLKLSVEEKKNVLLASNEGGTFIEGYLDEIETFDDVEYHVIVERMVNGSFEYSVLVNQICVEDYCTKLDNSGKIGETTTNACVTANFSYTPANNVELINGANHSFLYSDKPSVTKEGFEVNAYYTEEISVTLNVSNLNYQENEKTVRIVKRKMENGVCKETTLQDAITEAGFGPDMNLEGYVGEGEWKCNGTTVSKTASIVKDAVYTWTGIEDNTFEVNHPKKNDVYAVANSSSVSIKKNDCKLEVVTGTYTGLTVSYENNEHTALIEGINQYDIVDLEVKKKYWLHTNSFHLMFDGKVPDISEPSISPVGSEEWYINKTYSFTVSDLGTGVAKVVVCGPNGTESILYNGQVTKDPVSCSFLVEADGEYTIKAYDAAGNFGQRSFTENHIATVPATTVLMHQSEVIPAESANQTIWINEEDIQFCIEASNQTEAPIVSYGYTICYSDGSVYSFDPVSVNSTCIEEIISNSCLKENVNCITFSGTDAAGMNFSTTLYIKKDTTKPEYDAKVEIAPGGLFTCSKNKMSREGVLQYYALNVYENWNRDDYQYHLSGISYAGIVKMTIHTKDEPGSGLDYMKVKGFSCDAPDTELMIYLDPNDLSQNAANSNPFIRVESTGTSATVSLTLYSSDYRFDTEDIMITAVDKMGNERVYEWTDEEKEKIIVDGINPTGTCSLEKDDDVISNMNDDTIHILSGNIVMEYHVSDKYLYETAEFADDGVEGDVDYTYYLSYKEHKNSDSMQDKWNIRVQPTNMKKGVAAENGELIWDASIAMNDEITLLDQSRTLSLDQDGLYTFTMKVKDTSGNVCRFHENEEAVVSFYYDLTKPKVTVEKNVEDDWVNTDVIISGNAEDFEWGEVTEVYYTQTESETFEAPEQKEQCGEYKTPDYASQYNESEQSKQFSVTIPKENEFNGYYHFWTYDTAGNCSEVASIRIQIDSTKPTAELDVDTKKIHNEDVKVAVSAKEINETNLNSGLEEIQYEVYCDGRMTESGKMPNVSGDNYTGEITVSAKENEGDVIFVTIKVLDHAGNEDEFKSEEFKIDVTNPEIEVSYDNNDVSNEIYFHNKRVATVTITEHNFDASLVKFETTGNVGGFTSNGDTHVATVTYDVDGEHTMAVSCTDMATNESEKTIFNGASPEAFTVDLTSPKVTVTYNNNNVANGYYYKDTRTATIAVIETNFDAESASKGVVIQNGNGLNVPGLSGWTTSGNTHTATIQFTDDAEYTIDIQFNDLATNQSELVEPEHFILDQELPVVNISGIANETAYNTQVVSPVILVSDDNYDINGVVITLFGAVDGSTVTLRPTSSSDLGYAHRYEFANIEKDGVYELSVQVSDLAGNVTDAYISEDGENFEGSVHFSVNRNGSVYTIDDETVALLDKVYSNEEQDIMITETNVNILTDIEIVLTKDNKQISLADFSDLQGEVLKEGNGYTVKRKEVNGGWSQYTYTISKNNFTEDGVYHVGLYSVDEAGNYADTDLDEAFEMTFVIDKTAPIYIVSDLDADTTYNTDQKEVTFSAKDNMALKTVSVILNEEEIASWSEEEIRAMQEKNEEFAFVIPESVKEQSVTIFCVDMAGNVSTELPIKGILVTTNGWVRFRHNKTLVAGTSVVASLIFVGGVSGFGVKRRKKMATK